MSSSLVGTVGGRISLRRFIPHCLGRTVVFAQSSVKDSHTVVVMFLCVMVTVVTFIFNVAVDGAVTGRTSIVKALLTDNCAEGRLVHRCVTVPVLIALIKTLVKGILNCAVVGSVYINVCCKDCDLPACMAI